MFGKIINSNTVGANCVRPKMQFSKTGILINSEINKLKTIYASVFIDEYIIMPNHIHIIIVLSSGRTQFAPTISRIIKQFKGSISKQLGYSIWQKLFYEHIIRNEKEFYIIKQYIQNNIINWSTDKYFS